jgi:hypothetical protein
VAIGALAGGDDAALGVALVVAARRVDGDHDTQTRSGGELDAVTLEVLARPQCTGHVVEPLRLELLAAETRSAVARRTGAALTSSERCGLSAVVARVTMVVGCSASSRTNGRAFGVVVAIARGCDRRGAGRTGPAPTSVLVPQRELVGPQQRPLRAVPARWLLGAEEFYVAAQW